MYTVYLLDVAQVSCMNKQEFAGHQVMLHSLLHCLLSTEVIGTGSTNTLGNLQLREHHYHIYGIFTNQVSPAFEELNLIVTQLNGRRKVLLFIGLSR